MGYDLEQDIIGCLDYSLRHSSWFSGMSGKSLDDLSLDFCNDRGVRCELKVRVEVIETDESDVEPIWVGSEEETAKFLELAELYSQGDLSVYRGDSPEDLAYGLMQELPDGKAIYVRVLSSELKKNHSDVLERLRADQGRPAKENDDA